MKFIIITAYGNWTKADSFKQAFDAILKTHGKRELGGRWQLWATTDPEAYVREDGAPTWHTGHTMHHIANFENRKLHFKL